MGILLLVVFIVMPYLYEQYTYWRFTGKETPAEPEKEKSNRFIGYGLGYGWDLALFLVLVYAGYRFIWLASSLNIFDAGGVMVFMAGVGLRVLVLRKLGEFYDVNLGLKTNHKVITTGPYRYVRHPLHLGTDLQIIGLALLAPPFLSIPAILLASGITLYRNHLEDKTLIKNLGEPYLIYFQKTWDPIDMIYRKDRS